MIILLVLGVLEVGLLAAYAWLDAVPLPLPRLLPVFAFGCYGIAGLAMARSGNDARRKLAVVWGVGVLARVALLPVPPELSGDLYRYLWDGHVFLSGENPYAHAPGHEAVASLRTPWHGLINHPDVPTIYPPGAQFLFALTTFAGGIAGGGAGGPVLMAKLLWIALDLACGFLLQRVAVRRGRRPESVLLWYLWSPLLIVETAWNAHLDAAGVFFLGTLLWVAAGADGTSQPRLATRLATRSPEHSPKHSRALATAMGTLLGCAAMVKVAPAALLPALARRLGLRNGLWGTAAFALACAALWLPFSGAGGLLPGADASALTAGLRTYAEHWSANSGAFAAIDALVGDGVAARWIAAALVAGVAAFVAWRRFSLERAWLWVFGAGLLLSPTVHPWYALWVLPVAALRGSRPFLLLTGLVSLGYWGLASYQAGGEWLEPAWVPIAIWLPVWALLLAEGARTTLRLRRTRHPHPSDR